MERVWVESRHDINMEHDEDENMDIERFIINGGVGDDDDDDDNALDDDHGDQEHSTHGLQTNLSFLSYRYAQNVGLAEY
jgi:hypothetical protein